jgi:hypothetical protein
MQNFDPPATAGGTDIDPSARMTFEAKPSWNDRLLLERILHVLLIYSRQWVPPRGHNHEH